MREITRNLISNTRGSIWRQLCYQPWSPDLEPFLSTVSFYSVSLVQQTSLEKMLPDACTVHTVIHSPSHRWSDQGWAGQPWPREQGWASVTWLPQEFWNLTWKLGDHIQNKWAEEADQNKKEWGARERQERTLRWQTLLGLREKKNSLDFWWVFCSREAGRPGWTRNENSKTEHSLSPWYILATAGSFAGITFF